MAKIPETSLQTYADGDKVYALDYNRDREVIRVAINDADDKAINLQTQLNTLVVNGESSLESAQARIPVNPLTVYATLKERLDAEYTLLKNKADADYEEFTASGIALNTRITNETLKSSSGTNWKNIDGLIWQWGEHVFSSPIGSLDHIVTFPIPFPTACIHVSPVLEPVAHQIWIESGYTSIAINGTTSVRVVHFGGVPSGLNYRLRWKAMGY